MKTYGVFGDLKELVIYDKKTNKIFFEFAN